MIEKFDDDGDDESQRVLFQPPAPLEISRPNLRTEKPVLFQEMVMFVENRCRILDFLSSPPSLPFLLF